MAESANNPVNSDSNPSKMPPGNDAGAARANPAAPAPASVPVPPNAADMFKKMEEALIRQTKASISLDKANAKLSEAKNKEINAVLALEKEQKRYQKMLEEAGDAGLSSDEIKKHAEAMVSLTEATNKAKNEHEKLKGETAQITGEITSAKEKYKSLVGSMQSNKKVMDSLTESQKKQLQAAEERATWNDVDIEAAKEKAESEERAKKIDEQTLALELSRANKAEKALMKGIEDEIALEEKILQEKDANAKREAATELFLLRNRNKELLKSSGLSEKQYNELRNKSLEQSNKRLDAIRDEALKREFEARKKAGLELARLEQNEAIKKSKFEIQQAKLVRAGDIKSALEEIKTRKLLEFQMSKEGQAALSQAETEEEREKILERKREEILRSEETKSAVLAKVQEKHQEEYQKKRLEEIQKIAKEEKITVAEATKKFDKSDESTKMSYESKKELEDISRSMDKLYTINEQGQAPLLEAMESIDESSARSVEESVEGKYTKPMWAMSLEKVMGAGFADTVSGLASGFNSLKPPGGGWFKTLLLVGAFIVGGIIAYLAKWIVIIGGIIGNIGKFLKFPVLFAKLGNMFTPVINAVKGVAGFFGFIFGPQLASAGKGLATAGSFIGKAAATIMKIFPFLGNIVGAFRFGFALVSKVFLPLQIIISLIQGIIGAFKGFKKDGLRGAIAGFFANIISGLTFGLVKFDSVYKLFRAVADIVIFIVNAIWMGIKALWFVVWNVLLYPVRKMVEALFILIKGLVIGFIQGFKVVAALVNGMFILIGNILDEIVNTVYEGSMFVWEEVISPAIDAIVGLFEPVGEFFGWVYDEYVQPVFDGISGFFGGIGEFFVGVDEWLYSKLGWLGYTKMSGGGGGAEPSENSGALASGEVTKAIETTKEITQSGTGSVSSVIMAAGGGGGGGVQPVIVSSANSSPILNQITAGNAVPSGALVTQTSSVTSERERLAAAATKPSVVVNAPKTIAAGGGGGEGGMIIPKFSRNNDPTYRALCFMEAPAM